MHSKLRQYIYALVTEIVNDKAFGRGFGTLEKDRDDPWTTHQMDDVETAEEEESNPLLRAVNKSGRDNPRTRPGT